MQDKELYFITGIGRSGTTLLSTLLNNHPAIQALPEANFLTFFLPFLRKKKNVNEKEIELVFEQIKLYALTHPWIGWEFDAAEVKRSLLEIIASGEAIGFERLCTIIYEHFEVRGMDKYHAKILLDKNPGTTLFLEQILEVFPGAKFILMVRDYRGNVLSRKQNVYLKTSNMVFNAFRWRWMTERALRFKEDHPEKVLIVRYEDLTCNGEAELKKICSFFDVSTDQDLLDQANQFEGWEQVSGSLPGIKKYADKKFADLSSPVNQKRASAWQTELSPGEIITCDVVCSKTGANFGYAPFYEIGKLKRLMIKIKLLGYRVFVSLYMNKEVCINYVGPRLKMWRLKSIYQRHGFGTK